MSKKNANIDIRASPIFWATQSPIHPIENIIKKNTVVAHVAVQIAYKILIVSFQETCLGGWGHYQSYRVSNSILYWNTKGNHYDEKHPSS